MLTKPNDTFIKNRLNNNHERQLTTYAELNFEERLSLLLESETLNRNQTKIQRLKPPLCKVRSEMNNRINPTR